MGGSCQIAVYVQNRTPHRVLENKTPEEVFLGKKPEVSHLRIFGCPMYIHIPKEKRTKLDPSGKKGIFVGYSESSKAYRKKPAEEPEEEEAPRIHDTIMNEETQKEDREFEEPQRPIDPPQEKNAHMRKPAWVREVIQGAERYGAPEENHRERKRTRSYSGYVALLCDFINK